MWRLLENGEEKRDGDETFIVSGRDFGWYQIRTTSSGSLWLEGDLPVRRRTYGTCNWREDSDGDYETDCRNMHYCFHKSDEPTERGYKFCPYCGRKLVEIKYTEED